VTDDSALDPDLLAREAAVERVLALRERFLDGPAERVSLDRIAGRTLAEPIVADGDLPPRPEATMDGVALPADAAEDRPLSIAGEVAPEDDPARVDGAAVRIATGAPLPEGTDAVVMREHATVESGRLVDVDGPVDPGRHVYDRGTNVAAGERLFAAGERLTPRDAALLADLGRASVPVRPRPAAGVLATGTEIHGGERPDRDSAMLAGLVRRWGGRASLAGSVPDDYDRVTDRIAALAAAHDVVLTTGGTSVGRKDHAVRALTALGDVRVRGIRLRPGRPVAVAALKDHGAVAVAIPGKPVAALAAALAIARPLFTGVDDRHTVPARLARDVGGLDDDYEYWVPVTLEPGGGPDPGTGTETGTGTGAGPGDGVPEAMPLGHVDSSLPIYEGRFAANRVASATRATRAEGVVPLTDDASRGDRVGMIPFAALE